MMRHLQALALFGVFMAGCTAAPPPAGLELTLPDRSLPGVPFRAMANPYFRIVVEGADMAPVEVTGLPGERIRIEVEPGAARRVQGELYSEPSATLPTHRGEAGPFDLAANEERSVELDLWRLPAPAGFSGWLKLVAGRTQTCGIDADGELWCWGFNPGGRVVDADSTYVDLPTRFREPGPFADVALGDAEICAAKQAGGVFCLGPPVDGASDGTLRTVNGLPGPIVSLAAGSPRFCGAAADGTVWCWNDEAIYVGGQVAPAVGATAITGVTGAEQVVSTIEISSLSGELRATFCARSAAGAVRCWGDNEYGQLGAGVDPNVVTSVADGRSVSLPAAAKDLMVGGVFGCALLTNDELHCWGDGYDGLIGTGLYQASVSTPVLATSIMGSLGSGVRIVDIAASAGDGGYERESGKACILRSDGKLGCWGTTFDMAAYGDPFLWEAPETPILFDLGGHDAAVAQIVAGAEHTCWRYVDGQAACIGGNHYGQRGASQAHSSDVPVQVGTGDWIDLAVNRASACGVKSDGTLWCWGSNTDGQLGLGEQEAQLASVDVPTRVGTATDWTKLVGGGAHFCGLRLNSVFCWGRNADHEVDPGNPNYVVTEPTLVSLASSVLDIFAGPRATCARVDYGETTPLFCWGQDDDFTGDNRFGLTNIDGVITSPTEVPGPGADALSIAIMERGSCVLESGGFVSCMGSEEYGEVGNGGRGQDNAVPATTVVTGYDGVSAGSHGVCAWTVSGSVQCWGSNAYGAMGIGTYGTIGEYVSPIALPFSATTGLKEIVFGRNWGETKVVCGLTGAGALYCWGSDQANAGPYVPDPFSPGALGLGVVDPIVDTPQGPVAGGPWRKVGIGDGFSCAIETAAAGGDLFCWGWNENGRLGTGPVFSMVGALVPQPR